MEEKIIIGIVSFVIIISGLLCDCVCTAIFYVGVLRLTICIYSIFDSFIRNFYQQSLNHEQRYGSESWVFITGAANGIGLEYCKQLAQKKFNLIMIDLDKEGLERAESVLHHLYPKIQTEIIPCDLSKLTTVEDCLHVTNKVIDKDISIVINNAGIVDWYAFNEESPQRIRDIIQVNMIAPTIFSSLLYNKLNKRKHSGLINMSSVVGENLDILTCMYVDSKAFILYLTCALAEESKGKIDVLAVCPGFVCTAMSNYKKTKDCISTEACVSGALRDLGIHNVTNTHWIHELIFMGIFKNLWHINHDLHFKLFIIIKKLIFTSK